MDLQVLREKIDTVDKQLVSLIAERHSYARMIGMYKRQNNMPLFQPEREAMLISSVRAEAKDLGVDPEIIEKIFRLIMDDSKRVQNDIA